MSWDPNYPYGQQYPPNPYPPPNYQNPNPYPPPQGIVTF